MNHKKNSFLGDTYIKTKEGEIVIRAGMKLAIGWVIFALLCSCYVYAFFIRKPKIVPGENNTVELTIPENASYKKSDVSEINDLVSKYLTAKAACDQATLQSLVTDPTEFDDMSVLENSAKYLKGFEDTTCYLADGYAEGEYVVVELSYMDIADVESKPLDIVTFYIITDQDGSYKIANGELSNAQLSYLNSFKASKDIQDIYAHIHGGIPAVDIDGLSKYWEVFPSLKSELLTAISEKYYSLNVEHENIRQTIYKNAEFSEYGEKLDEAFTAWKSKEYSVLSSLDEDVSARELIVSLAEDILAEFEHLTLIDKYDVYQVLLAYWNEVMNDDVSLIISEPDGYANARATDNIEEEITQGKNKGEMKVTGWEGRLIPKSIVIDAFFREEKNTIEEAENVVAETESQLSDLIESADEESALADVAENGKVKAKDLEAKIEELTQHVETEETIELELLMNQLPMQKKRLQAYLVGHPLCKSALTDKGTVNKSSIMLRLLVIRTEESIPESLQDDVNQLKAALELCGKISDYNKVVKDLNKALDEKCRARYDSLTHEEILELLVNKKWFDSLFLGIADLYAAISHHLTNRIIELADRYEDTLPELDKDTTEYEAKVKSHLERMGFEW